MDPTEAYRLWLTATDNEQRQDAGDALAMWLRARGFEPKWTASQKRKFLAWARVQGVAA